MKAAKSITKIKYDKVKQLNKEIHNAINHPKPTKPTEAV